jgi:hypothetical protein
MSFAMISDKFGIPFGSIYALIHKNTNTSSTPAGKISSDSDDPIEDNKLPILSYKFGVSEKSSKTKKIQNGIQINGGRIGGRYKKYGDAIIEKVREARNDGMALAKISETFGVALGSVSSLLYAPPAIANNEEDSSASDDSIDDDMIDKLSQARNDGLTFAMISDKTGVPLGSDGSILNKGRSLKRNGWPVDAISLVMELSNPEDSPNKLLSPKVKKSKNGKQKKYSDELVLQIYSAECGGMSWDEISSTLGVPIGSIPYLLRRGVNLSCNPIGDDNLNRLVTPKNCKSNNGDFGQTGRKVFAAKKYSDELISQIYSAECGGMSTDEISTNFGIPIGSIPYLLRKAVSLSCNTTGEISKKYSNDIMEKVCQARNDGLTFAMISDKTGVPLGSVGSILNKARSLKRKFEEDSDDCLDSSNYETKRVPRKCPKTSMDNSRVLMQENGWPVDAISLVMELSNPEDSPNKLLCPKVKKSKDRKQKKYSDELVLQIYSAKCGGMSWDEISSTLGVPIGSIPYLLRKGVNLSSNPIGDDNLNTLVIPKLCKSNNGDFGQTGRKVFAAKKYSDELISQIYSAECGGMSTDELSTKFGIPIGSIPYLLRKAVSLSCNPIGDDNLNTLVTPKICKTNNGDFCQTGRKSKKYSDELISQIYSAECGGMSRDEISTNFGIPIGSIPYLLRKAVSLCSNPSD